MKLLTTFSFCVVLCTAYAVEVDDLLDRLDTALTTSAFQDNLRVRLSGTIDLEFYNFQQPAPGLIDSKIDNLFSPRLTLFLDAQLGPYLYFFGQARVDREFDPSDRGAQVRLDEYALRITPWEDGRFTLQAGKFATVIGNWIPRHLSWDNPFINAPLVYENVTPISDLFAPASPQEFVYGFVYDPRFWNPVIWGPNYASGVSVSGKLGQFDYAAEIKNASLSSRQESWSFTKNGLGEPSFDGRIGFRPNQMWNFGFSAADGVYFQRQAEPTLPQGRDIDDYRELLIGQDVSFAWHHLQLWAEFYETRFEVPRVGNADTFAYYFEAKYKFTPQFFGALRWNQQLFGTISEGTAGRSPWAHDLERIDIAAGYRLTSHVQLKLQYSFQHETTGPGKDNHLLATQLTVRF